MERTVRLRKWVVVVGLTLGALVSLLVALLWCGQEWGGLWLNVGSELAGAAVTYLLLELVIGRMERRETEERAREAEKADQLLEQTKEVNDGSLHVFFSDQRPQYREAILKSFGQWVQPERKGTRGPFPKPRLEPPEDLLYAQVVKHRLKGRVVKITEKVVFGTQEALQAYLERSSVSRRINTAFVERQNNTMRQYNRRFTRKTLGFSKDDYWLERQGHLSVAYYHFCLPHGGLCEEIFPPIPTKGSGSPKKWRQVTPTMSAGVTDHVWTLQELLTYRVPPNAPVGVSCAKPHPESGDPEQATPARAPPGAIIISTIKEHDVNKSDHKPTNYPDNR